MDAIQTMAGEGLRILGVAKAKHPENKEIPKSQHAFDFEFVGLI
jgi:hypothetical protein